MSGGKYAGWDAFEMPAHRVAAATKQRKYRNQPTEHDGIVFASKREADRYVDLRAQQARGEIEHLEVQPKFPLHAITLSGVRVEIGCYLADFGYLRNGEAVWEDAKGMRTALYQWKKKHVEIEYGVEIVEV